MRIARSVISSIILLTLGSCTSLFHSYWVDGNVVRYHTFNEVSGYHQYSIEQADPRTFRVVQIGREEFGFDEQSVFFEGQKVEKADPKTFRQFSPKKIDGLADSYIWYRDKTHVYDGGCNLVREASADTFEIVDILYSRDGRLYFFGDWPILGADYETFQVNYFGQTYSRDANRVFVANYLIDGANPEKFTILTSPFSRDGQNYFSSSHRIEKADYDTFQPNFFGSGYSRDRTQVFHYWELVQGADPESFQLPK